MCLSGEVETPSFPIRRQAPDVKYPEKMKRRKGDHCITSLLFISYLFDINPSIHDSFSIILIFIKFSLSI